jgi:hypothetical protein
MTMQDIIIDLEFKDLLPPLDKETYASLEANIIASGCRDPLILWNGVLIDGHNRYAICTEHGIPFNTVEKEFASREDALIWIITNQVSRRNMNPSQLSYYRGLHYRTDKKIQGTNNQYKRESESPQNGDFQKRTVSKLAETYNVSKNTIGRDAKASEAADAIGEASPEAKRMILSGGVKIEKKALEALAAATKEEIAEVAAQIEAGTYEKKKPDNTTAEEPDTPTGYVLSGMQPLDKAITSISDSLDDKLPAIKKKAEREKLKAELRTYINKLESLYARL